jgi:hypothetical protein
MNVALTPYKGHQFVINACARIATQFDSLEKFAKISYRIIDIAATLKQGISLSFVFLSSQIKDLVFIIESTRIFVLAPPLILRDEKGRYFFSINNRLKIAERISIVVHSTLKMIQALNKLNLIHLKWIARYVIGNLPIFKWLVEGSIWMFYIFGCWDSIREVIHSQKKLKFANESCLDLEKRLQVIAQSSLKDPSRSQEIKFDYLNKIQKWKNIQNTLNFDLNKAWMKIAAGVTKILLISLAVTFAVLNIWTIPCQLTILSLGTISDSIGLARIFYIEYF